jgi:hypothetical protein
MVLSSREDFNAVEKAWVEASLTVQEFVVRVRPEQQEIEWRTGFLIYRLPLTAESWKVVFDTIYWQLFTKHIRIVLE